MLTAIQLLAHSQNGYACETMVRTYIKDKRLARVQHKITLEQVALGAIVDGNCNVDSQTVAAMSDISIPFPAMCTQARLEKELERRLQLSIRPKNESVLLALAVLTKTAQKRKQKGKSKAEVRREAIAAVPAQEDLLLQPD